MKIVQTTEATMLTAANQEVHKLLTHYSEFEHAFIYYYLELIKNTNTFQTKKTKM